MIVPERLRQIDRRCAGAGPRFDRFSSRLLTSRKHRERAAGVRRVLFIALEPARDLQIALRVGECQIRRSLFQILIGALSECARQHDLLDIGASDEL